MSYIIEQHIKAVHEMQKDLLSDGEIPVPFSDWAWHAECLVNGSDEPEALANLIAKGAVEQSKEYADKHNLYRGIRTERGDYAHVRVSKANGDQAVCLCFESDCFESQVLALSSIADKYPNVIWL